MDAEEEAEVAEENSVEMESMEPLCSLVPVISAGPKQLSTTGKYARPWNRPKTTTPKKS